MESELDTKEWRKPVGASWVVGNEGWPGEDCGEEYVKKKLQEVESGDYRAEELSEVVSRDEVDPDSLLHQWDSKGNSKPDGEERFNKGEGAENPDSFRQRLTGMRNAYQMVAPRHTNRPELQGQYVKVFEDFKDYRMNQDGTAFPRALRLAWRDPTTKDRHFTTPLALFAKRPSGVQPPGQGEYGEAKEQRFEAKGGKDKGRGKGKQPERSSWCCTSSRDRRERIRWLGLSGSLQRSFPMCWKWSRLTSSIVGKRSARNQKYSANGCSL